MEDRLKSLLRIVSKRVDQNSSTITWTSRLPLALLLIGLAAGDELLKYILPFGRADVTFNDIDSIH